MNNSEIVIDPLGNEVILPRCLSELPVLDSDWLEVYDKPSRVIESPAMILQVTGAFDEFYYFRSIGWESLLLIGTKKIEGKWTVHLVVNNPSSQQFRDIYQKGKEVNLIDCKALRSSFA